MAMKKEKHETLTENRLSTISKRETDSFDNSEVNLYPQIHEDKNQIFRPKVEITPEDLAEIPFLPQIKEAIQYWENRLKTATGKDAYLIKQTIIDLRKDQYLVKNAYRKPISLTHITYTPHTPSLDSLPLHNPKVCEAVLCNYSKLKAAGEGNFESDTWCFMEYFDSLCAKALAPYPSLEKLVELKIDGKTNEEIQAALPEFAATEYISTLWRKRIPKLIASIAEDEYLDWYYLEIEKGSYKKCSSCGQIKLIHNKYFSRNTTKNGFYSMCKECRRKR